MGTYGDHLRCVVLLPSYSILREMQETLQNCQSDDLHHRGNRKRRPQMRSSFLVEEDGFEPSKSKTTDLQSAPFGHLGTPPYEIVETWSWWTDSNPRPADYKSAALPAELHQRVWHITFAAKVIIAGVPPIVNRFSQKNEGFFQQPRNPRFRGCHRLISRRLQ